MRSILLLPLVTRCLQTICVYMEQVLLYARRSNCVGGGGQVCGIVCCVSGIVKDGVLYTLHLFHHLFQKCEIEDTYEGFFASFMNNLQETLKGYN